VKVFDSASTQEWISIMVRESELPYDWQSTANQFALALSPLRLTARIFFSQLSTCGHSPYITSSLTRGWVCHLQLLLALASVFILGSESRGTHDHILLSQIRDFIFCRLLWLAGLWWRYLTLSPHGSRWMLLYSLGTDCMEITASHGSSLVASVFIAMETCLSCLCLAMTISSGLCYSTFQASYYSIKILLFLPCLRNHNNIMNWRVYK
jgi:hypothetical protein